MTVIAAVVCGAVLGATSACNREDQRVQAPPTAESTQAVTMQTATSSDGTFIAYEKQGSGPAVVIVNGALADRSAGAELAGLLASHFTVYTYDRRGRGASGDTQPYAPAREIEDLEAVIDAAGGSAYVFGSSSGAALSLEAASALGGKITKLALYEAPYDGSPGVAQGWRTFKAELTAILADGRNADAVNHHLTYVGVPPPALAEMKASPMWAGMEAMAPTLAYDSAVVGEDRAPPVAKAARVTAPALVMDGGASRETMPFMAATADALAQAIPNAQRRTLEGQAHNAAAPALAPVLIEFLSAQ